LQREPQDLAQE
jgi:hypothetical protein